MRSRRSTRPERSSGPAEPSSRATARSCPGPARRSGGRGGGEWAGGAVGARALAVVAARGGALGPRGGGLGGPRGGGGGPTEEGAWGEGAGGGGGLLGGENYRKGKACKLR